MGMNICILHGNLTRDVEVRQTPGGTAVGNFGVAVNRKFKDREDTLFMDCTAWGRTAEVIGEHFGKGKEIVVQGRLETQAWDDKDGNKRSKTVLVVESFDFCGGKADSGSQRQPTVKTKGWDPELPSDGW